MPKPAAWAADSSARRRSGVLEGIGKKGGSSTANAHGPEFFGKIGRKGGRAVTAKYGAGHFERIGRRGGQKSPTLERAKTLESAEEEKQPVEAPVE